MEKTHIPLEKWFWSIYFFSTDKRGYSASKLSKELSITYKTAWYMLHRNRNAMKDRDSEYLLKGLIQLDDSFFGSPTQEGKHKRGRGTEKAKVIVGLSTNEKRHPEYLKMKVVKNLKGQTIVDFALAILPKDLPYRAIPIVHTASCSKNTSYTKPRISIPKRTMNT